MLEKGKLETSGNRVDLHDRLYVSKYGLFQPHRCIFIPLAFVSRGGYFYPSIAGLAANGIAACGTQNKVIVTGKVDIAYTTLASKFMLDGGYTPPKGSKYILISNDGEDEVRGRFKNLSEGSSFSVDGVRFRITYRGGTGNDVVITRI